MSVFLPLQRLRDGGLQPTGALIWLGLGLSLPKRNTLTIDPINLPSDKECRAVAGLDVIICFNGYATKYRALRLLCGALLEARPTRLQVIDFDYKRIAFLKHGGCS
jgi:hypothetical protein